MIRVDVRTSEQGTTATIPAQDGRLDIGHAKLGKKMETAFKQ